jgi:hypothetical protein
MLQYSTTTTAALGKVINVKIESFHNGEEQYFSFLDSDIIKLGT